MKEKIIKKVLLLAWSFGAVCVFFSAFETQLFVGDSAKKTFNIIFPEGWGFFTKNPRDLGLEVYKIEGKQLEPVDASTQSYKTFFGLSRSGRLVGYEASTVASEVPKKIWKESPTRNIYQHINDSAIVFNNKSYFNHLKKGEYLLKLFKPIPFAWANNNQEKNNPFSIVKIKIL